MVDFSPAKIPIIAGINDTPLEPNFNNNGKGCNGSYFLAKFHLHVDLTEDSINDLLDMINGIVVGDTVIPLPGEVDCGLF
jgi:hypothetical protein